jgi:hypothetical protein
VTVPESDREEDPLIDVVERGDVLVGKVGR